MTKFTYPNIFYRCEYEELKLLYEESKKYNHFSEIPETSPLYKYMMEYVDTSIYKSISIFYLNLTRALIDKTPRLDPELYSIYQSIKDDLK